MRSFRVFDDVNGDPILQCSAKGNGETIFRSTASHIWLNSDDIKINGQPLGGYPEIIDLLD